LVLRLCLSHQLPVYADDVCLLDRNLNTTKNTHTENIGR
jgi:hypothetical protein